jgi:hypothetical protein
MTIRSEQREPDINTGEPQKSEILVCADDLRALYPSVRQQFRHIVKCVLICSATFLLGTYLKMEWLGVFAIALCAVLFIVPLVLRIRRFLASLPCGSCGKPAGRHSTGGGVLHLKCEHCGSLTRTDCLMSGPGKPTKI